MGNDTSSRYITTTNNYTNNPIPYTRYNYFQGQMVYNSLRDAHGAPASAIQSLEIINTSGNNTVGGIQFYTSVNADIPNPVWMGGFQTATSEFKLPSTVTASLPQITNVSTINSIAINSFGNPIGTIISFAMLTPPSGYLLCNGQAVSQTTYAPLYAVIGTTYGGGGGNFNLPDCLGKVMMGAIAGYAPGGTAPTEGYNAVATFQGFVSGISAPFGSVTTGMYFSSSTKPITAGMLSGSQALFQSASYVVQYVVASDGMRSGINRGFLIMFEGNCGPNVFAPRIAQGDTVAFNANPATSPGQNYPQLGNQDNTTIGTGTMGIWQDPSQVGSHTHNIPQGGAQAAPGATYRAGDPNTGGPASGSPNSDFSFTAPAYGGFPSFGVTAPRTMFSQPYNLGVSMCIKY